ncbi:MAG: lysoplasmalogenase family protein [Candidatus Hodarchaeota archaeon]
MASKYLATPLDYIRLLVIIAILILETIATQLGQPWFLSASICLVILALVNFIDLRQQKNQQWEKFALLLFIAMIFGSLGDFFMAGVIFLTPDSLINGILFFGMGHFVYLLALRNKSSLLLNSDSENSGLILRNLIVWLVVVALTLILFFTTIFNPSMLELSIGALGYGIMLATALGFALAKWQEEFPIGFRLFIFLGFLFFLFSDWLIAVHRFTDETFLSGPYVGITYIIGQLLIQLSVVMGYKNE